MHINFSFDIIRSVDEARDVKRHHKTKEKTNMKKLMFVVAVAAMSVIMTGCSKESKMESLVREMGEISEASKDEIDAQVKETLEEFKKMSAEEQEKALEEMEEMIEKFKEEKAKMKEAGDMLKGMLK